MEAFATVDELCRKIDPEKEFSDAEKALMGDVLLDATAFITSELRGRGIAIDSSDEVQSRNLRGACLGVSGRMLASVFSRSGLPQVPLTSYMQTAGAFTEQMAFPNPLGDKYLTREERKSLGLLGMRMRTIPARIGGG